MKHTAKLVISALCLLALIMTALAQVMNRRTPEQEATRVLLTAERALADALSRGDAEFLKDALAPDFTLDTGSRSFEREKLIARTPDARPAFSSFSLEASDARIEGAEAFTQGHASVAERAAAEEPAVTINLEPITATKSAVVNFSELASRSAQAAPPENGAEKHVVIPPPISIPDEPAPAVSPASGPLRQFRYTAHYRRHEGRWQAVRLQLTPEPER